MRNALTGSDWILKRWPDVHDKALRAWDTADEYLVDYCREQDLLRDGVSLLIVNDAFGALAVALQDRAPQLWNDSHLGLMATRRNLQLNKLPAEPVFILGDEDPAGRYDLVLLKLPKAMALLEDQLLRLRAALNPGATVIAGGMIKHSPRRAYELLETCIGPTRTTLGVRKARLAVAAFDAQRELPPALPDCEYALEGFDLKLANRANVFSRESLDIGTRLLLQHLPRSQVPLRMADLGCGNGALALALARRCPNADILGTDESYQAIACARANAQRAGLDVRFEVDDALRNTPSDSLDLVVCNPPFHQGVVVGDQVAWGMLTDARRALRPGGELRIVGNAHLGYREKMMRLFGDCEIVASDRKFTILSALKPF